MIDRRQNDSNSMQPPPSVCSQAERGGVFCLQGALDARRTGRPPARRRIHRRNRAACCSTAASRRSDIAPASAIDSGASQLWRKLGGGKPRTADLILFSRQMYTITKSGLPLLRASRALLPRPKCDPARRARNIIASLESGRDLASSFARHPAVFSTLYDQHRARRRGDRHARAVVPAHVRVPYARPGVQDRVRGAVRYPMIVVAASPSPSSSSRCSSFRILRPSSAARDNLRGRRDHSRVSHVLPALLYVVAAVIAGAIAWFMHYTRTEGGRYRCTT